MRVFVTGGTGHSGSYIIPELIAAGHEVTGLARSDTAAAAVSALGAKVRRGDLEDLDGLKEAAADSDGVIHVAHRQDLLASGGIDAVAAAELPIMLAYGEALAETGKPLVAAGSIGSPGNLGRPATEEDPTLPGGDEYRGTLRVRNVVETAVVGLAERGVRSSVVRIANIAHSTTDRAGFLVQLIALAKEKGFVGYPGDGANLWNAVHVRDVASLFRLALEKGPAGKYWHAVTDGAIPLREIAEAIGSRLGLPAVSVPADVLMVPGYFGFLANIVTQNYPASNLITRRTLGWEPTQPGLLADLDNGHYFSASRRQGPESPRHAWSGVELGVCGAGEGDSGCVVGGCGESGAVEHDQRDRRAGNQFGMPVTVPRQDWGAAPRLRRHRAVAGVGTGPRPRHRVLRPFHGGGPGRDDQAPPHLSGPVAGRPQQSVCIWAETLVGQPVGHYSRRGSGDPAHLGEVLCVVYYLLL